MSDELEKKLKALTETGEFQDGAMRLGPSGFPSAMVAILQAIETTILPRVVKFSVGDRTVSLNVGGRRLRAFMTASPELNPTKAILGRTLSADDPLALQEIGALLRKLVEPDGVLTMSRSAELTGTDQTDAGVGINTLVEVWGVDVGAEPLTQLEIFVSLIGTDFVASVQIDGKTAVSPQGDTKVVEQMETDVLSKLTKIEQQLSMNGPSKGSSKLMVLEGMLKDECLIAFLHLGETKALVATKANAFAPIATAWSRI